MIVTKEEAGQIFCPMSGSHHGSHFNFFCKTDKCMWWIKETKFEQDKNTTLPLITGKNVETGKGYCGGCKC